MEPLSVSDLNGRIRLWFQQNEDLAQLVVVGEVGDFKRYPSGHCYFSLKDDRSSIRAVMWRTAAERNRFLPRSGEAVFVIGRVDYYEGRGDVQLNAAQIFPAGLGLFELELQLLRERLAAEGLFDERRKRALPARPRRIGVVTSAQGAAWQDIQAVIQRRCRLVELILAPCLVQGEQAPASIAAAIAALQREPIDVLIVARGGGSNDDLSAFQTELVARAAAASTVPLISGVGHETDTTLIDEVADQRAATPSVAAEMATPNSVDLHADLSRSLARLQQLAGQRLLLQRAGLQLAEAQLQRVDPRRRLAEARQRLAEIVPRTAAGLLARLRYERSRIDGAAARLEALNPLKVLARGYALVRRSNGAVVQSPADLRAGETLQVEVRDGRFAVQVVAGENLL